MSAGIPDGNGNRNKVPGEVGAVQPGAQQEARPRVLVRDRLAKGLVMFVLAILVIIAGLVGYVTYYDYVEPNMPVFVCCVPSVIVASALMFFGFARRSALVRQVNYIPLRSVPPEDPPEIQPSLSDPRKKARKVSSREFEKGGFPPGMKLPRQTKPVSKIELEGRRKKIRDFLTDLDEQYKDGLLLEDSYKALRNKNLRELRALEIKESLLEK